MPFKLSKSETSEDYSAGEHVVYIPLDRTPRSTVGMIDEVLTDETPVESASSKTGEVNIHASEQEPRYMIRNLKTGKSTAYKRYNIMRKATQEEVQSKASNFSLDQDVSPHAEPPHHGVPIKYLPNSWRYLQVVGVLSREMVYRPSLSSGSDDNVKMMIS
uniref:Hypervirulence associated protein TUDOR domain-containing protein n=1 Tax=Ditylenchus dipsaci TaxID=166011 RepID=A0A915ENU3_9BILA